MGGLLLVNSRLEPFFPGEETGQPEILPCGRVVIGMAEAEDHVGLEARLKLLSLAFPVEDGDRLDFLHVDGGRRELREFRVLRSVIGELAFEPAIEIVAEA